MTYLVHSSGSGALKIAVGLITIIALGSGATATAGPVPPTIAFGAATGKPQAPSAAVYGVALGGTPAAPTLTATLLNQSPEPTGVQPAVSSLVFFNNATTGTLDLLASNLSVGDAYRLLGPSYSASSTFFRTGAPDCGAHAAGLGVDASGNVLAAGLFTDLNCFSPPQPPGQLGVFYYFTGDGTFPVLMDNFNTDANLPGGAAITSIVDAVVAPSTFANGIQAGDLLVLVGDTFSAAAPPVVVRYPHTAVLQGIPFAFPIAAATALVTESVFPNQAFASYDHPVSMAISPLDGTLLIATTDGTIWQLAPTQSGYGSATIYAQPNFANFGLPGCFEDCGLKWGKIGAGLMGGNLYVVATVADTYGSTANESGILAMFSGPLPQGFAYYSTPSATVNINALQPGSAVQPISVAVLAYRTGTTSVTNCFNMPCDVLGDGVMLTTIRGNTQGIPAGATITQQECVVLADPRGPNCGAGSPAGVQSLPLKQVCPGLSDSLIIPSYLCGSAGASGTGFVVIEGTAEQEDNTTGIEVITNAKTTPVLGSDPGCPADHVGYQRNDHSLVESDYPEYPNIFEVTNSCSPDPTNKNGPHNSTDIVGLEVANLTQLFGGPHKSGPVGFVDFKFNNLQQTIKNSNIKYPWERIVVSASVTIANYLVDIGHYDCAAEIMYLLDKFVRRHVADFLHSVAGAAVREPNPAFDIIMRLSNGFYSIETGILNKAPYPNWPLTADPRLCRTIECKVPGMDK
jgi:hypothetical protein